MALNITLIGAAGRMGHAIIAAAKEAGVNVAATVDAGDDLETGIRRGDVVIDFSSHKISGEVIRLAALHGKAIVMGTTGHSAAEKAHLLAGAARVVKFQPWALPMPPKAWPSMLALNTLASMVT